MRLSRRLHASRLSVWSSIKLTLSFIMLVQIVIEVQCFQGSEVDSMTVEEKCIKKELDNLNELSDQRSR